MAHMKQLWVDFVFSLAQLGMCTAAVVCGGRRGNVFLPASPAGVSTGWKKLVGARGPEISNMRIQVEYAERQKCREDNRVGKF